MDVFRLTTTANGAELLPSRTFPSAWRTQFTAGRCLSRQPFGLLQVIEFVTIPNFAGLT